MIALALPVSRCTTYYGPDGKIIMSHQVNESSGPAKVVVTDHYPLEHFTPGDVGSWMILLAYVWPVPFLVYHRYGARAKVRKWLLTFELLLPPAAGYFINLLIIFGKPALGAYVAWTALAAYFAASAIELLAWFKPPVPQGSPDRA